MVQAKNCVSIGDAEESANKLVKPKDSARKLVKPDAEDLNPSFRDWQGCEKFE